MKQRYFILLSFLIAGLLFLGCKQEDLTPSYLEITLEDFQNSIDVSNFNQEQEDNRDAAELEALTSQMFREVWISVNGDNRGVYTLPCKIPLLEYGTASVQIDPAIRLNGNSNILPKYPFINSFITNMTLERGETNNFQISPITFKYLTGIKVPILETFDQSSSFTPVDSLSVKLEPNYHIDGRNVGKITLQDPVLNFEIVSKGFDIPLCQYAFVEIDYRCEEEFTVGAVVKNINGLTEKIPLVNIRKPKENDNEWRKIYVNLTQVINSYLDMTRVSRGFKIYFTGSSSDKTKTLNIYMDNVKLIYLN